jgi:hypothetical protein
MAVAKKTQSSKTRPSKSTQTVKQIKPQEILIQERWHEKTPYRIAAVLVGAVLIFSAIIWYTNSDPCTRTAKPRLTNLDKVGIKKDCMTANVTELENGLKIEDLVVGNGREVVAKDNIKVHYVGTLADGTKFDSSYDRGEPFPVTIGIGGVIQGWDLGVPGMKVGGKRRLTIPPALGYGDRAVGGNLIPANSTLIFEVEVVE